MEFRSGFFALLLIAGSVFAAEGRLEINEVCAVQGGCFPGDTPGYPVLITEPGSYVLTSNLQVPNENTTAIDISGSADGTTVDLNGFRIQGVTTCSPINGTCTPSGTGVGINASVNTVEVRLQNGTVSGMGSHGILLQNRDYVSGVTAINNAGVGIEVGPRSSVIGCQAMLNGSAGIRIDENNLTGQFGNAGESILTGNLAAANGIVDADALDIEGSRSGGGNVCSDNSCSLRDARRFYLTADTFSGANASTACTRGYHMASLWEIFDTSNLQYAVYPQRGVATIGQLGDQGSGPPSNTFGWIRTGNQEDNESTIAGEANCFAWISTGGVGTVLGLTKSWESEPPILGSWVTKTFTCATKTWVWCVED